MRFSRLASPLLLVTLAMPTAFAQHPDVAAIARSVTPSVVLIQTRDGAGKPVTIGTGFVLRADGVIATNLHVIVGAQDGSVELANGDIYDGIMVMDVDTRRDLAVLKIRALNLTPAKLGDSDRASVGNHVTAIGNPMGLEATVSDGIVSGIRQMDGYHLIQTTAPISPGSSGGPLINDQGEVIGLTEASLTEGQNINLAIPINYIKPLISADPSAALLPLSNFANTKVGPPGDAPAQSAPAADNPAPQQTGSAAPPSPAGPSASLPEPPRAPMDGAWNATIADSLGSAELQLSLVENSAGDFVGTYTTSLGGGGQIKGQQAAGGISFELTQQIQGCPGVFKGTGQALGSGFQGSYTGTDCQGSRNNGTFTMSRGTGAATGRPESARSDLLDYFASKAGQWRKADADGVLGSPTNDRFVYDRGGTVTNHVFAYVDPTGQFLKIELSFSATSDHPLGDRLAGVMVYPANLTFETLKQKIHARYQTKRESGGSRYYFYPSTGIGVQVDAAGVVVSVGKFPNQ